VFRFLCKRLFLDTGGEKQMEIDKELIDKLLAGYKCGFQ